MILQETAARIWQCYREIESGEKLLSDMEELRNSTGYRADPHAEKLKDSFGHGQNLQLGIPMGENGHSLFGLSPAPVFLCIFRRNETKQGICHERIM